MAPLALGSAGGDREHPRSASQSCAGLAALGTGARCKCGWRAALCGRLSGPSGRTGGTTGRPTPRTGSFHPAPKHDGWLCARLLIPNSLLDTITQHERHRLRLLAGVFQLRAIRGVQGLRRQLAAPTPNLPPSPMWITRFTAQQYIPRETPQNLRNMVAAPTA